MQYFGGKQRTAKPITDFLNSRYGDPPYRGTTKIFNTVFNSDEFWNIMRKWSKDNIVVISEYQAPEDFECILKIDTHTSIRDKTGNVSSRVEKLFKLI